MHILQVEDDQGTASIVKQMLRKEGHRCVSTNFGEQALQLSQSDHFDVILLDIMLPDIDGYEVMRRLREGGVRTPVVIQTGLVDRTKRSDGLGIAVTEFLVKPFNRDELVARLETAISRSKMDGATLSNPVFTEPKAACICGPDRRKHRRFRSLKSGRIAHDSGIDCVILNMLHNGAAIRLPDENCDCPQKFVLRVRTGSVHHCEVCWRHGNKLGVRFLQRSMYSDAGQQSPENGESARH